MTPISAGSIPARRIASLAAAAARSDPVSPSAARTVISPTATARCGNAVAAATIPATPVMELSLGGHLPPDHASDVLDGRELLDLVRLELDLVPLLDEVDEADHVQGVEDAELEEVRRVGELGRVLVPEAGPEEKVLHRG